MRKESSIPAPGDRANTARADASRGLGNGAPARTWLIWVFVPLASLSSVCGAAQSNDSNRVTSALTKAADKTGAALRHGAQVVGPAIDTGVSKTEKGIKKGISFVGREMERAGKKIQGEYRSHIDKANPNQNSNSN